VATFTDSDGVQWLVSEVVDPPRYMVPRELLVHPEFARGWLHFRCAATTRRLAPYPSSWRLLSPVELEGLCRCARPEVDPARVENSGVFRAWRSVTLGRR